MQRRLVRIANAVLDLKPHKASEGRYPRLGDMRSGILKLDRNEATVGPSPATIEAIKNFITNGPLNWFPDPDAEELKVKISEYVSQPGQNCMEGYFLSACSCLPGPRLVLCLFSQIDRAASWILSPGANSESRNSAKNARLTKRRECCYLVIRMNVPQTELHESSIVISQKHFRQS